jgi:pimeloyl-ACP methyl ester carboxylesterase
MVSPMLGWDGGRDARDLVREDSGWGSCRLSGGDGAIDVLVNRQLFFPVDLMWDEPRLVYFLNRLSSFCRHIWFDPRGTGASDWIPHAEGRLVESIVDDMVSVLDDVGCERVALLGLGPPVGLMFVAAHPERTTALVLINAAARYRRARITRRADPMKRSMSSSNS